MQREVAKRLLDAYSACVAISEFTRTLDFNGFAGSALVRSAVERQFEIIGEALGRAAAVDASVRRSIPEAPQIIALRNRLIHGYDSVDDQIVWDIVQTQLPVLRDALKTLLHAAGFL